MTHWGRARRRVCVALTARARRLIDHHSLLTRPSVTGVQALCLFSQLHHMSDLQEGTMEREMEGTFTGTSDTANRQAA
jgi:hypothetical protein